MPQDKLIDLMINRPVKVSGEVQYPKPGDPGVVDDKALRALMVGLGLEEQQPGDAAGAVGGALGAVSLIPPSLARARGLAVLKHASEQLPEDAVKALEFAQQRWPRLFGHVSSVGVVSKPAEAGRIVAGYSTPVSPTLKDFMVKQINNIVPGYKFPTEGKGTFSALTLNKDALRSSEDTANTIGHELLHTADALRDPNSVEMYNNTMKLPNGYYGNSQEIRARIQGAKTKAYYQGAPRKYIDAVTGPNSAEAETIVKNLDPRISNLSPDTIVPPEVIQESPEDKLYRLVNDRMQRRKAGLPMDPRVPDPRKQNPNGGK